jgi:Tfp pilus assembly protein PilX
MSTGTIVVIIIAIIVVVAIIAGVMYDMRRRQLRQRFGPEYDRLVEETGSKSKAEAELRERQRRVSELDIRPLDAAAQARYTENWAVVQEQFVDAPQDAVTAAQRLVMTVMNERGYPTEGSDQVLADLSVEHANTLDHYRAAYGISQRAADGTASTEDLRQAMIHYRALFQDLLGTAPATAATAATNGTAAKPVVTTNGLPGDEPPTAVADVVPAVDREPPVDGEPTVDREPAVDDEPVVDEQPGVDEPSVDGEPAVTGTDVPRQRR